MTTGSNGAEELELDVQREAVRRLLNRGVLFSILWLMGVGSAIALYCGLRARGIARASGGRVRGGAKMWWCLIVGTIGIVIWAPIVAVGLFNQVRTH